jgi:hypothetical protein
MGSREIRGQPPLARTGVEGRGGGLWDLRSQGKSFVRRGERQKFLIFEDFFLFLSLAAFPLQLLVQQ